MGYSKVWFNPETTFLVTGGAGFIGSNLCEAILNKGCKVICFDNLSTGKQENVDLFVDNKNYIFVKGDIRNYEECLKVCEHVDFVLHQAAWGSVPRSIEMPLVYEEINIKGTLNMLEAAVRQKVKKFIYASSSSVYGDSQSLPKVEGEEGDVLSPYALTKLTNEKCAKLYHQLYGLDTFGLRYFNVFGKRQDPYGGYAAVIPKFIKTLQEEKSPEIYGDGTQSRDFTYIDNVVEANLKSCIAPKRAAGEVYNIAFGGQESLNNVYIKICDILDKNIKPIYMEPRKGDILHSNACIKKAGTLLSYHPEYGFEQGLKLAINWYCRDMK